MKIIRTGDRPPLERTLEEALKKLNSKHNKRLNYIKEVVGYDIIKTKDGFDLVKKVETKKEETKKEK